MNELKVFVKEEFGSVRAVIHDGEPWFGASDIARALGYSDADDAVRRHCNYTKLFKPGEMPGLEIGPRGIHFIPESDGYALIFWFQSSVCTGVSCLGLRRSSSFHS